MRRYIEEWFKKAVKKLIDEGKRTIETVTLIVDEIHKRTSVIE
jgi:hypothetical protein